jgi:hypothetical protein
MIRYQLWPETATPAHVVRQLLPTSLRLAVTLVPVVMTFFAGALVEGFVRRLALHRATFERVAPRTSPGNETATTANTSIADRTEAAMTAVSDV